MDVNEDETGNFNILKIPVEAAKFCFFEQTSRKNLARKGWILSHVKEAYVGSWDPYKFNNKKSKSNMKKTRANLCPESVSKIDS